MNTSEVIEIHGSITKNESLSPVGFRILENTFVSEAVNPCRVSKPDTLFLFTKKFYPLIEILKVTCKMYDFFGYTKKLDIATAILDFTDHYQYAIRVRDFPDYEHIHWIQTCYQTEGIDFLEKMNSSGTADVTVFKCFNLIKVTNGIYLDKNNEHKGYISIPHQISKDDFLVMLEDFRSNHDCELFDAAIGTIDYPILTENIIRIYTENMNLHLLECAKQNFDQKILNNELNLC